MSEYGGRKAEGGRWRASEADRERGGVRVSEGERAKRQKKEDGSALTFTHSHSSAPSLPLWLGVRGGVKGVKAGRLIKGQGRHGFGCALPAPTRTKTSHGLPCPSFGQSAAQSISVNQNNYCNYIHKLVNPHFRQNMVLTNTVFNVIIVGGGGLCAWHATASPSPEQGKTVRHYGGRGEHWLYTLIFAVEQQSVVNLIVF